MMFPNGLDFDRAATKSQGDRQPQIATALLRLEIRHVRLLDTSNPNYMIESLLMQRLDRLTAFFEAFELTAHIIDTHAPNTVVNLVIERQEGGKTRITYSAKGCVLRDTPALRLAAATVDFGGMANPLLSALPELIEVELDDRPQLGPIVAAFVAESDSARCGQQAALNRLCEVIVLMLLRDAIKSGTTKPGLLAGLSHPALHHALVAMHEQPTIQWRIENLAEICGMSRSRFMAVFPSVVGMTPSAYLSRWRLSLARRQLLRGDPVKSVARYVGFGSAPAFSRAYMKTFGHPPVVAKKADLSANFDSRSLAKASK